MKNSSMNRTQNCCEENLETAEITLCMNTSHVPQTKNHPDLPSDFAYATAETIAGHVRKKSLSRAAAIVARIYRTILNSAVAEDR
jgi:hypothetical protein